MTTTVGRPQLHKSYIDLDQHELRNPQLHQLGADPGTPVNGQFFYRTDTNEMRVRVNGAWQNVAWESEVGAAGIPGTIFDAKGDIIVATAADTYTRKAAGANGTVLFPNSAQADGLEWRAFVPGDIQTVTTDRLLGRDTASTGVAEMLTVGGGVEFTGSGGIQSSAYTGDVTKAAGGVATTIAANAVDNTKAADMAQSTIKGRAEGAGTGDPTDLSVAQVKAVLDYVGSEVAITPFGNVIATNVQSALQELETDLTTLIGSSVQGFDWKEPVRAATTTNGTLATAYENGDVIDGITLATGDRILLKDQTTGAENGIYTVNASGAPTRATDMDVAAEANNATVLIEAGTVNAGDIYTQTANIVTLGTTAMTWVKSSEGNAVYTADEATLQLVGTQFSIKDVELLAIAGLASIADRLPYFTGTGTAALATFTAAGRALVDDATASDQLTTLGFSAFGKTLIDDADAAALRTTIAAPGKYATDIGNGSLTSFTVTHSLGTKDVIVEVFDNSTFEKWEVDVAHTTTSAVTITFTGHTPTSNQFRVVVIG